MILCTLGFVDCYEIDEAGSESNSATLTFDGVDKMGERLANEVFGSIVVSLYCNMNLQIFLVVLLVVFDFYV